MIKKLFTGLLVGLGVLFVSFSNAGLQEFDLGELEEITVNTNLGYSLRLTQNANFLTNDLYKVIQFKGIGNYPRTVSYFWNGTGMYFLTSIDYNKQGYFNYVNIVKLSTIDMQYAVAPGFTPISDFLENNIYSNPDKLLIGGYGQLQNSSICFGYTEIDKAVCFGINDAVLNDPQGSPQYVGYLSNNKGYTTQELANLASYATISPFVNIPWTPDPGEPISTGYNITNSGVIASFNQLGYDRAICYGGVSSGTYNRLVGRTGMNLFEIYNTYNPLNLNLHDWYDYYRNGYIDNPTVTSDTGSVFIIDGVFRMPLFGLFGFGYEYVQLFPTDDILQYCDILLNRDPNAYYTGDDKEDIIGFVIRSGKYTLSGATWQTYNGPLSMLSGSDREMSYRDFFNNISNNFANSFDDIPMNIVGVVPKYILMFMFALIFIRMISK